MTTYKSGGLYALLNQCSVDVSCKFSMCQKCDASRESTIHYSVHLLWQLRQDLTITSSMAVILDLFFKLAGHPQYLSMYSWWQNFNARINPVITIYFIYYYNWQWSFWQLQDRMHYLPKSSAEQKVAQCNLTIQYFHLQSWVHLEMLIQ